MSEHNNSFNERFDAYYHALRDYSLYKGEVEETDNLPNGIHASIIRYQPTYLDELDELEETEEVDLEAEAESSWDDIPF